MFPGKKFKGGTSALIHSTDSAQHLWGDIQSMLCTLDEKLEEQRTG
jgi:hypothetical protein